jgi:hypothetical protein
MGKNSAKHTRQIKGHGTATTVTSMMPFGTRVMPRNPPGPYPLTNRGKTAVESMLINRQRHIMPPQNCMVPCIRCGKPVDKVQAIAVRLNNRDLPNGPTDKRGYWGYEHAECATPDDLPDLDGSKCRAKRWNKR